MTLRDSVRPKMPDKWKKVWVDFPCSKTYLKVRCILVQRQHIMITKRRSGIPIIWVRRSNPLWRGRQKGHKNACQYNHEIIIDRQKANRKTYKQIIGWKDTYRDGNVVSCIRWLLKLTPLVQFLRLLCFCYLFYPTSLCFTLSESYSTHHFKFRPKESAGILILKSSDKCCCTSA